MENGERRQVKKGGFRTKREAQTKLTEALSDVDSGTFVNPTTMTVGEYLNGWLDGLPASGRRATTVYGYRRLLERHAIPNIGSIELQSLTPLALDRLYAQLLATGRMDGTGGLSHRSVRYLHTVVGKALSDAERKGVVKRNVTRLASPPSASSARAPEMAYWTPDELRSFLGLVEESRHYAFVRLASMSGLRRGELCGLRWTDVDLEAGRVSVRQAITTVKSKPILTPVKTARSRRVVDVDPVTVAVLKAHRSSQLAERLLIGSGYRDHGLVFVMPDGTPTHPNVVSRWFDRAVTRSKLRRVRLHDLRHTHASHLLAAGVNVKVVSDRLGHASVSFTLDTYAHVMPGQQADAAASVAALVDG